MGLFIRFECGRRSTRTECFICGHELRRDDATQEWVDTHALTSGVISPAEGLHKHRPALEEGPTFGPFDENYLQLTYLTLRYEDEVLASWDADRSDWIIESGERKGEAYSDIVIFTAG